MFSVFYNAALFLVGVAALPQLLWNFLFHGKYRQRFQHKALPSFSSPLIWIHAVSVGEVKAASALFPALKKQYPGYAFLISTTTETGYAEAQRGMQEAEAHIFLPLDFSWTMKRLVKTLDPRMLILVESDLWYHLLHFAKAQGASTFLVNGKISERSFQRFRKVPFLTQRLWQHLDSLCVQNSSYKERFESLGCPKDKIMVTGNLKFDICAPSVQKNLLRKKWGITEEKVIVLGSTHPGEEELLLKILLPFGLLILAPRHPERFSEVEALLKKYKISYARYSEDVQPLLKGKQVLLLDVMGALTSCYQMADVAIVCGSFIPGVGGHNIFEPMALGTPTLFGPFMQTQAEMASRAKQAGAAVQVKESEVAEEVKALLEDPMKWEARREAGLRFAEESRGTVERTLKYLIGIPSTGKISPSTK